MQAHSSHENDDFVRSAVERFQAPLLRYAARLTGDLDRAHDIVQDTFVRLMSQPTAAVVGHEAEWLFTVCRHRALDVQRKEGRMKRFSEGEADRLVASEPHPGKNLETRETSTVLLSLIHRLPVHQQEVVRLKFQNGFSYQEISRITSLSVTNVGFLLHTAIKTLRAQMVAQAE